jgi:hypothetical protein
MRRLRLRNFKNKSPELILDNAKAEFGIRIRTFLSYLAVLWIRNFSLRIRIRIRIRLFNEFRIRIRIRILLQKVPVSDPTFFPTKHDFKGPKMAFQNIFFKE